MRTKIKILIAFLLAGSLLFSGTLAVLAQEIISIETGDAGSETAVENTANTDVIEVLEEILEVENESQAEIENIATSTAETGDNTAESQEGTAAVVTGNADASLDIINLVNTTILGSNGTFSIVNAFSTLFGNLDLSSSFDGIENNECPSGCGILSGDVRVKNENSATITNDVVVRAGTGGNSALGTDTFIETGDANAAANVLNITNTNIIGSNYLLLVFNNFEDWGGNLIFPSKYAFKKCCPASNSNTEVFNNNYAGIENNASILSESGENTAEGLSGAVLTGEADSALNIVNQANTNIFGSDSVYIILRYFGDWEGSVYSLPDGVSWTEGDGGLAILSEDEGGNNSGDGVNKTSIENKNSAQIKNNVKVFALTGKNKVDGPGQAAISTGNARAAANIVNIANTNVVGRNWIFAIINIFGDWHGNVAFGQPDLWVGETVSDAPERGRGIKPGYRMTYNLTVLNNGDTDATNVTLRDDFDEKYLNPENLSGGNLLENGLVSWNIGTLKPGEAKIISYDVSVKENLPVGENSISNTAKVSAAEPDASGGDNTETTSVLLTRHREPNIASHALPDFRISKTSSTTTTVRAGDSVDYKIVLKNEGGGSGFESVIKDNLYYASGTDSIDSREWELDTVYDGEEITVTYTLEISDEAEPGIYKNTAKFFAKDERGVLRYIVAAESYFEIVESASTKVPSPALSISTPTDEITGIMAAAKRVFVETEKLIAAASDVISWLKSR